MEKYNIIVENENDTVVSEYKPLANKAKDYQTESELESQFISMLKSQGYEYLNIHNEEDLINNLRHQIELLNKINFSDNEWKNFFNENIANKNFSIKDKSRIIQEDYRQLLTRDDGSHKNIILIDKDNIHNNKLQVINQYEEETGNYKNRYDVTILVNGIPMVHIELKRRGVALKEAFNQIIRYQRDSFWASNGLYEYVQVFVISNGANTKYYSNTTRLQHVNKKSDMIDSKTSKSFEFTHFWSDSKNNPIHDLIDFTSTFFSKHTILNILTKYCVFTSEEMLLVMRPYQIVAVEKIINKINISHNYKKYGSIAAGGFIWHTTGSGKTLTSFKTAKLASQLPYINKVIFVVDRRDLDYQTMKEYDKLEKGAANSNRSTSILQRQLESNDPNKKIIITTIQKLSIFIKNNRNHPVFDKEVVLIFDECHRSQFGSMHTAVIKNFKKYYLFGFTGTPIFAANINKSSPEVIKTTEQAFGQKLHTYTIINAINDRNVLPFKIEYIKTIDVDKSLNDKEDQKVKDIDRESVFLDQRRIKLVVEYILKHFDQKTRRNSNVIYSHSISDNLDKTIKRNVSGFNSIMAVSSIEMAKKYYLEFKNQLAQDPKNNLKIALIYSYGVNTEESYAV
ncbi:type I restriction endonuclease subunit R [Metamycoplasma hominis]|uniref:type I restriction endonuclease subunit R n=1 Tax=Metamycoplasma hominis TaxID=2098 RepID=UPI00280C204C|nr:HsdR family type I site-specific deoxyribonuclease [Metamycoplasma hominis]